MFVLFPFASFVLLFLIFLRKDEWRDACLSAELAFGLAITALTELLSLCEALTFNCLLGAWAAITFALGLSYVRLRKKTDLIARPATKWSVPLSSKALICAVGLILALLGLIALIAPPNSWDSMSYRMSRVVHWIQQASVAHYPTPTLPQLHHSPWADFAILHLQVLSGADRFANLVDWSGMIGSIICATLIARQLGATVRSQVFAAIIVATIPMGILQASSTQHNWVFCFWLECFAYYVLKAPDTNGSGLINALAAGASLGLAVLTKGTAYFFALPFLVWFCLIQLKTLKLKSWKPLLLTACIVLAINFGHYTRNVKVYGTPLGPNQESPREFRYANRYNNDAFTPGVLISNVSRNLGLELGTPFPFINSWIADQIRFLHHALGLDVNDARITHAGTIFEISSLSLHEDVAGSPIHFVLIIISLMLYVWRKDLQKRRATLYALAITCGFLLFSLVLRWQPWHCRLLLPLLVLWSAFVAAVLGEMLHHKLIFPVAAVLTFAALPWIFLNESRSLIGKGNIFAASRVDMYFANGRHLIKPYKDTAQFLNSRRCSSVGLYADAGAIEYPLWALLQRGGDREVRIEHVDVRNASTRIFDSRARHDFHPCAIVALDFVDSAAMIVEGDVYAKEQLFGPLSVFVRQPLEAVSSIDMKTGTNGVADNLTLMGTRPSVKITSPSDRTTFPIGATITFEVQAEVENGNISKVELYSGHNMLYEAESAPYLYSAKTSIFPTGTYPVTAIAVDDRGVTAHSRTIYVILTK